MGLSVQRLQHCAAVMLASFTSRTPVFESVRLPQASVACAALGWAVMRKLWALLVTLSW
jgi:hypothetical protein